MEKTFPTYQISTGSPHFSARLQLAGPCVKHSQRGVSRRDCVLNTYELACNPPLSLFLSCRDLGGFDDEGTR